MKKKTLAMLMAAALCVGLLPVNAMASLQEQTITAFSDAEGAQEASDEATLDFADEVPTETGEDPQGEATDAAVQDAGEVLAGADETEDPQEEPVFGNEATDENVIVSDEQEVPQTDQEQEETEENDIALLDATQVLNGSGSVSVYDRDSESETPEYILKVTDAPTNTEINLESPHITLTYLDGSEVAGVVLSGNLSYVSDTEEEISVAYLMLDDDTDEDGYILTPYGADDEAMDMDSGRLVITVPANLDIVYIYKIQTNTLCYEDESGVYETEVIEAAYASEPILCDLEDYAEGETVDLATLAGVSDGDFFYGSIDGTLSLSPCSQAQVQDGKLLPLDESGAAVSDVDIYFAYDELYSFDVAVGSVVNEHTEDNGDAYLWFGDTFYVDQYHSQGVYLTGYSNNATETADCGIWPMLGRTREALINGGTYGFDHWMGQDLNTWEKVKAYDGVSGNDLTKSASGKDNGDKNYGIVGPFQFTDGETDVTQSTVRVTGRIGDEFTASEVFGSGDIYMIREDSDYHTEWYNLGSHASDNGKRAWFYWINDFYILNNYQDLLEYVQIVEDDTSGEVHLLADEIGEDGSGELIDVWDLEGIYTKRNAAVKTYIADHADELIEMGVGLSEYLGWLDHIQLRMYTTVETVINGIEYNGTLSLMTRSYTPTVTYDITYTDIDGTTQHKTGSETVTKQNEQECNPVEFDFYINPEEAFDADNVQITLDLGFNGTLYGEDGSTIEYTNDEPYIYQATLTSDQLWEAYDCCPNNTGYDFAINLSDAVKTYAEDSITLYKIWEDDSNAGHYRDNVTSVTVYLERSKDGETWEDVVDDSGAKRAFVIHGSADSDVWSLTLTAGDLDLTYTDTSGAEQEYQFRISAEQDLRGVSGSAHYTYTIGEGELSLTVTNTLETYPIDIVGEKQWLDENGDALDEDKIPGQAVIALYQNGKFYDMTTVTSEDNWKFSFTDLPQVPGDDAYVYTLGELGEDGSLVKDGGFVSLDDSLFRVETEESEDGYIIKNIQYTSPEVGKYVSDPSFDESTDDHLKNDEADNNDTMEYLIVVDHVGLAKDLVIHDLLDEQLDISTLTIKSVTLFEKEGDEGHTIEYTETEGSCSAECGLDGCSFEIHIDDSLLEDLTSEAYIEIVFDISLKEGAEDFDENLVDKVINQAGLSYMGYAATYAEPDEVDTYSFGFNLFKYTGSDTPLGGAEFVLSKADSEGVTEYAQFDVSDDIYLLSDWTTEKESATTITSNDAGEAVIEGLHEGTYSLEETKAPDGYQAMQETLTVVISVDEDNNPVITVDGEVSADQTARLSNEPLTELTAIKIWDDENDNDGKRPASITFRLFANGVEEDSVTVTEAEGWTWTFTDLPQYKNGEKIVYAVVEEAVYDYSTTYDGSTITNSYTPGKTSVTVVKGWDDGQDADGIRPKEITVELIRNGSATGITVTLSEENDWIGSFTDLDIYTDGVENDYTVQEISVEGYTTKITGDASTAYVITNTHTPSTETPDDNNPNTQTGPGPVVGNPNNNNPDNSNPSSTSGGKTGDNNMFYLWIILIAAAAAMVVIVVSMRTRKAKVRK